MNQLEFVKYLAKKNSISQKVAEEIVHIFVQGVIDAMEEGRDIKIIGFGSWHVAERPARIGHNPKTLQPLNIPAQKTPVFKPSAILKRLCNKQ